jgi:hypothetical protein
MNDEVRDGIYWGALCDKCAGALLAEALDEAALCTFALTCRAHGLVGIVACS